VCPINLFGGWKFYGLKLPALFLSATACATTGYQQRVFISKHRTALLILWFHHFADHPSDEFWL